MSRTSGALVMVYRNNEHLKSMLLMDKRDDLADQLEFEVNSIQYERFLGEIHRQKPQLDEVQRQDRAAYRCLTSGHRAFKKLVPESLPMQVETEVPLALEPNCRYLTFEPDPRILECLQSIQSEMVVIKNEAIETQRLHKIMFKHALILLVVLFLILYGVSAFGQAQTVTLPTYVVAACGDALPAALNTAGGRSFLVRDTDGKLCVAITGAAGGTSATDNSVFTGGTTAVTPIGAIYDTTPPTITDGRVGAPRMDSDRSLHVNCITGCAAAGDVTGTTVALNTLDETAQVDLAGENGANVFLAAGTLEGTLTPEVSYDDGTTWSAAVFINGLSGAITTSQAFTNPNAATSLIIGYIGPVTQARVRLSTVVGGTANATLRATVTRPYVVMFGSDGTNIRQLKTDTGGAVQVDVESGTLTTVSTVTTVTNPVTVTDGAGALNVIVDSGTVTAVTAITNALPAGTNNIGDVDVLSIAAGNNNIGDVDIASGTVTTVSTLTTLSQLGGVAVPVEDAGETAAGTGIYAMGVRRDTPASSAGTTGDNVMAAFDAIGQMWTRMRDPCSGVAKTYVVIDIVTATTVELANAVAGEFFYICSVNLVTAGANNVVIAEDDTDGCGSPSAGVTGGVTAAEGWNFLANSGIVAGGGNGAIAKTTTAERYLCLLTSAAVQLSGSISFVSAP